LGVFDYAGLGPGLGCFGLIGGFGFGLIGGFGPGPGFGLGKFGAGGALSILFFGLG